MNLSNALENLLTDGLWRGGALNSSGTVGSTAVVTGVWTATTAYVVGNVVVPHANMTGAGGKFLRCTTPGTSGSTNTLAVPNPGSTLVDGGVTWTAVSGMPSFLAVYAALFVANKGVRQNGATYNLNDCVTLTAQGGAGGDNRQHVYFCSLAGVAGALQPQYNGVPGEIVVDGTAAFTEISPRFDVGSGFPAGLTEVTSGSYARVKVTQGSYSALTDWAGTQGAGTTTASTGTSGTTSNNFQITFPQPTADWATGGALIAAGALYDQLSGGLLLTHGAIPSPVPVANGDLPPFFPISGFTMQQDN